jgi:hypothetical protein
MMNVQCSDCLSGEVDLGAMRKLKHLHLKVPDHCNVNVTVLPGGSYPELTYLQLSGPRLVVKDGSDYTEELDLSMLVNMEHLQLVHSRPYLLNVSALHNQSALAWFN